jgi:hypothetical protein
MNFARGALSDATPRAPSARRFSDVSALTRPGPGLETPFPGSGLGPERERWLARFSLAPGSGSALT